MNSTAAARVWEIPELHLSIVRYTSASTIRTIACVSRSRRDLYRIEVWGNLNGIGNLFALLHDSLRALPTGPGSPTLQIPEEHELDAERLERFFDRAALVRRVQVNEDPRRWIRWGGLRRLLAMLPRAGDNRLCLLPWVTHFWVEVDTEREVMLGSMARMVANPLLEVFWVTPCSAAAHPWSPIQDSTQVLQAIGARLDIDNPRLRKISLFPETPTRADELRAPLMTAFQPVAALLASCTISEWFLSSEVLLYLGQGPLERLEVQGRTGAGDADLRGLADIVLPEGSFVQLRTLVLSGISLECASDVLRVEALMANVSALRIEIAAVHDIEVAEGPLYIQLFQLLGAAPQVRDLCLIAGQAEHEAGYVIAPGMVSTLIANEPDVLRLYRFRLNEPGFLPFHPVGPHAWGNVTRIAMMHQDLTPDDISALCELPSLGDLSGNIALALAPQEDELTLCFPQPIHLSSQFRLGDIGWLDASSRSRNSSKIGALLKYACPRGLSITADREFYRGNTNDERDLLWANAILKELRKRGACDLMKWNLVDRES